MPNEVATKPIPIPDELSEAFWSAASEHRLAIQRCQQCQAYYHPPVSLCPVCHSEDLRHENVSGRGKIYSFTITHDARTAAFEALQPYAIVWVQLEEMPGEPKLIANMPDTPIDDVQCGASVEVDFEDLAEGVSLPQFRLTNY